MNREERLRVAGALRAAAAVLAKSGYLYHVSPTESAASISRRGFDPRYAKAQRADSLFFSTSRRRAAGWWDQLWGALLLFRIPSSGVKTEIDPHSPHSGEDVRVFSVVPANRIEYLNPETLTWEPVSSLQVAEYEAAYNKNGLYANRVRKFLRG